MAAKLHKLDLALHTRVHLTKNDHCFYFLEKEAEGYTHSEANNLVYNFKKPLDRRGKPEWSYKEKAIRQFTQMLCGVKYPEGSILIPAPTSNPRADEAWDDRIDRAVLGIKNCRNDIAVETILDTAVSHEPAHSGGDRSLETIRNHTVCNTLSQQTSLVFLVDDVLTTGAHFKVWKEMILESNPGVEDVIGLFLSLHMW